MGKWFPSHSPSNKLQREACPLYVLLSQGGFEVAGCGRERFRYRAIFFGILRQLLESLFVYAWHNGLGLQVDRVDGEAAGHWIEVYTRSCMHARWREASTCERVRQRHRVTTGVRGANELLGIGADCLIAHAWFKRITDLEGSTPHAHGTLPLPQIPLPFGVCCTCWHTYVSFSTLINHLHQ